MWSLLSLKIVNDFRSNLRGKVVKKNLSKVKVLINGRAFISKQVCFLVFFLL